LNLARGSTVEVWMMARASGPSGARVDLLTLSLRPPHASGHAAAVFVASMRETGSRGA